MTLKTSMFKKSLIATALVVSTLGAFAQASTTPMIATKTIATTSTAAAAKTADATTLKVDEKRKAKRHAKKVKQAETKAALAKDMNSVKPVVPVKP
jgi:hypothetical protein